MNPVASMKFLSFNISFIYREMYLNISLIKGIILQTVPSSRTRNLLIYMSKYQIIELILVFNMNLLPLISTMINRIISISNSLELRKECGALFYIMKIDLLPAILLKTVTKSGVLVKLIDILNFSDDNQLSKSVIWTIMSIVRWNNELYIMFKQFNGFKILYYHFNNPNKSHHNLFYMAGNALIQLSYSGDVISDGSILLTVLSVCSNWYRTNYLTLQKMLDFLTHISMQMCLQLHWKHVETIIKCLGYLFNIADDKRFYDIHKFGEIISHIANKINDIQKNNLFLSWLNQNRIFRKLIYFLDHRKKINTELLKALFDIEQISSDKDRYHKKLIKYGILNKYHSLLVIVEESNSQNMFPLSCQNQLQWLDILCTCLHITLMQLFTSYNVSKAINIGRKSKIGQALVKLILHPDLIIASCATATINDFIMENPECPTLCLFDGIADNLCLLMNKLLQTEYYVSFSSILTLLIYLNRIGYFIIKTTVNNSTNFITSIVLAGGPYLYSKICMKYAFSRSGKESMIVIRSFCQLFRTYKEYSIAKKFITFSLQYGVTSKDVSVLQQIQSNINDGNCAYCAMSGNVCKLKACTGCITTSYCSRLCQKKDWNTCHRQTCNRTWYKHYRNLRKVLFHQ
eukprot:344651_1